MFNLLKIPLKCMQYISDDQVLMNNRVQFYVIIWLIIHIKNCLGFYKVLDKT